MEKLSTLTTEMSNDKTTNLDQMSTREMLTVMNEEDQKVALAVQDEIEPIEKTVEVIHEAFLNGGKLFYIGAGTSGRIGFLDAAECPPTFSSPPELIQAVIAGGYGAMKEAVEGAEDNEEQGAKDLLDRGLGPNDVVIGIAASGRTPYVIGALKYAQSIGAKTVSLTSNEQALISQYADIQIEVITGPEVLTGSTRLKAATAHKLVLNMISTTVMMKAGKVYQNLMVDLNVSNHKLMERAKSIISSVTGASREVSAEALNYADLEVKTAIVMIQTNTTAEVARNLLGQNKGFVRMAIQSSK
ncbi:N-acetylmuramic acid 6-phosphate etherase [Pontibacillus marinus]|uniref:N-acetylmuramic acid 6-phosphate etherase n=1 Tax=Pontibacillus marinus BH030004 = DSM 16465 TaxID=1385511 RepID=A0A0A5I5T5_9BACI|nr:N-acetylmuramic acid 6-phosphate etherase [Pontibacillus marinus]KGX91192.1 N-acetylmuramic acid-6-phosphate etherase [Pontibacillus marinus BH030004 = DSM 16465]